MQVGYELYWFCLFVSSKGFILESYINFKDLIHSFRKVIKEQSGEYVNAVDTLNSLGNDRIVSSGIERYIY